MVTQLHKLLLWLQIILFNLIFLEKCLVFQNMHVFILKLATLSNSEENEHRPSIHMELGDTIQWSKNNSAKEFERMAR